METIKEKLRKIKVLADRGVDGEAIAAQHQLEKLLGKYNFKIEDIFENTPRLRKFKVGRSEEQLFSQTLMAIIGNRFRETYYYKSKPSEKYIDLSDGEFIDFDQQFSFHRRQLKKEIKKATDHLMKAYIYKHNLFNKDHEKVSRNESEMSLDEYYSIMSLINKLEDVTFRKQLTAV